MVLIGAEQIVIVNVCENFIKRSTTIGKWREIHTCMCVCEREML